MEIPIDRRGRVVIPDKVRESLGLEPKGVCRLEVGADHIRLYPRGESRDPLLWLVENPIRLKPRKGTGWKDEPWKS